MFLGKIKKFKTFNLTLLKHMGRRSRSQKIGNKTDHSSQNYRACNLLFRFTKLCIGQPS